jgi:RIO kinase 1
MVTLKYQERFKTAKGVFDEFTNRNLFELKSKGIIDDLESPIYVGKESNVFIAKVGKKKVIVKIYRLQNANFNKMYDYIRKDTRYQGLKSHRRQIIFAWTQREFRNLKTAEKANINSPIAMAFKDNIIVEEMIGNPAPALKDKFPENPKKFFDLLIKDVKKLYKEGLIHGDLSSFNILNFNEEPFIIDFSQATTVRTPNSEELLERDIKNLIKFFGKLGVKKEYKNVLKKVVS